MLGLRRDHGAQRRVLQVPELWDDEWVFVVRQSKEKSMAEQHTRTKAGTFRRERGDSLVKKLRDVYPEFDGIHGSTQRGTLEEKFGVDSLSKVRKALRQEKKN